MSLKLIGVGWGRTGTFSLKAALEILGFGPCYHMMELLRRPEHVVHWQNAVNGGNVDWGTLFHGYKAAVDYPTCQHWVNIGRYFKDAKFVLTVRDPDSWYESVKTTIYRAEPNLFGKFKIMMQLPFSKEKRRRLEVFRFIKYSIWETDFNGRFDDREYAIKKYCDHIDEVRSAVPEDKLLVYDVKSGWEPLCKFLGVDIPEDVPFPVLNKRDQFSRMLREFL
jgi:hypothetical protein